MNFDNWMGLYVAVCKMAIHDYKHNLKIIERTQSELTRDKAISDNKSIAKFLGEKWTKIIEYECYHKQTIDITKLKRKSVPSGSEKLPSSERARLYYELNKEIIKYENKAIRDKRLEMGLCTYCGKRPHAEGSKWCLTCREKDKEKKRAKKFSNDNK